MTKESMELAKKYRALYRWCRELRSYDYYIENQLFKAENDNAPVTAIYQKDDGTWQIAENVQNEELRKRLLAD